MATRLSRRWWDRLFGGGLTLVLIYACLKLFDPATPALIAGGLMLCAAAPLGLLLCAHQPAPGYIVVVVSALIGLGCVTVMIGIQRFGDQYQPLLIIAVLTLIGWTLYHRKILRD